MRIASQIVVLPLIAFCAACCSRTQVERSLVLYCSVDDVIARPIITDFERSTGIKVRTVFDSESTKSVGLAVRIVTEREHPRADVFWNGEFSRTVFLKRKNVLAAYVSASSLDIDKRFKDASNYWTGHAFRARVIAFNTNRVRQPPRSIFDLTQPEWKRRVAICDPLIGTAAAWATALYVLMGEAKADAYFDGLRENKVQIVPGNSVVADLIAKGVVDVGVTDSDDVFIRKRNGKPIDFLYPDEDGIGTLVIPATVAMIKDAPHPHEARRFIDYLLQRNVEDRLASAGHRSTRVNSKQGMRRMNVAFEDIGMRVETVTRRLKNRLAL